MKPPIIALLYLTASSSVLSGIDNPYKQLKAPSYKDRQEAAIYIVRHPELISVEKLPALLEAVEASLNEPNQELAETLLQMLGEAHWIILSKSPNAVQDASTDFKRKLLTVCKKAALKSNIKFKRYAYPLLGLYSDGIPVEEFLVERYTAEPPEVEAFILEGLAYSGGHLDETIALLNKAASSSNAELTRHILTGASWSKSKKLFPIVLSSLSQENPNLQNSAIVAILKYGNTAKEFIPEMKEVLRMR